MRFILAVLMVIAIGPASAGAGDDWVAAWEAAMDGAATAWPAGADPDEARKLYDEALDAVGRHGPGTLRHARTLDELAYLGLMEGALDKAEPLYLASIPMLKLLLGRDQPRVATSLHNLGVLYLKAERDDDAEPRIREALRIWTTSFGLEHPDTARANRSLSVLMRRRNRHDEADRLEDLARRHLTAEEEQPGR